MANLLSGGTSGEGAEAASAVPLTAAQRGMWFAENMSADYSVMVAQYLDIVDDGRAFDLELFVGCVEAGARDLQSAYTRLVEQDGLPMQVIDPDVPFGVEIVDLRDSANSIADAKEWMTVDYQRVIDLSKPPLARAVLLRVADDRVFWYLAGHHLLLDGYAALNCVKEAVERYNAELRSTEYHAAARADIAELVADDVKYRESSRRVRDQEYWRSQVADLPERVTLARNAVTAPLSPTNVVASATISRDAQRALTALASAHSSSPAAVLTAAFSAFLARMTGTDDVVLSLPVTGRATARIKRAAGMVSNMLPVRARDIGSVTFDDLIDQVQLELTGALRHQRYRFEDIRRDAGLHDASTASFGPVVNMVFFDEPISITGATVDYQILSSGILEDLRINLYQAGKDAPLVVDFHGNPHLYGQAELAAHLDRFRILLDRLLAQPGGLLPSVDLLLTGEFERLRDAGVGPQRALEFPPTGLLADFETQVARHPDALALIDDGAAEVRSRWSYRELDVARRRLAARLAADGVIAGDRVVVELPRGADQIIAVYAVLTLGAAYVPVDPEQPDERRSLIHTAAQVRVAVTAAYLAADSDGHGIHLGSVPVAATSAAYVIFTSGSTGTPKGVEVSHAAIGNRLDWTQQHYPLTGASGSTSGPGQGASPDVVLYKTPITFDVSVWELFWPLAIGATTVIARPGGHRDPDYLQAVMAARQVTIAHFVPSMLDVYLDARPGPLPPSVRRIFTSGEALTGALADRLLAVTDAQLVNLYGPTEAAVDITEYVVRGGESPVPIGRAVPNCAVFILDAQLRPVPAGVPGELYLAGVQLATGYVGRADLTCDRFVANPYSPVPGERMYRTGDLVRWNSDGAIDYLGRTDFQVKIRGQRVEPGEIDGVLLALEGVGAAATLVRTDMGAVPIVVAYVRRDGDAAQRNRPLTETDVIGWCARRLPGHMVPSAVVILDEFPVNASGKLDRKALPAPSSSAGAGPYEAPRTQAERLLASLVGELVGRERISLRDSLFGAGGDSLAAARLVARARREHGIDLQLADVFESQDLAEMAARARVGDTSSDAGAVVLPGPTPVHPRPEHIPLSFAQTRLWFINRMDPSAPTYNMPGAVRLRGEVDTSALTSAVRDAVVRHEILHTTFPAVDGEPIQAIGDPQAAAAEIDLTADIDLTGEGAASVEQAVAVVAGEGFDLARETPFRCRLIKTSDGHVLVMVLHHIAGDGLSLRPLIRDILVAYHAHVAQCPVELPALPVQYADVALWQRSTLAAGVDSAPILDSELAYWAQTLAGAPELLALPTDRQRPHVASGAGDYVDTQLGAEVSAALRERAKELGVTAFTVVHAALALTLARLGDTNDVAIGTAIAGRDQEELTELVGMFVNTVVLRSRIDPAATVADFLMESQRVRTGAMVHSTVPFERVVEEVAPTRSAAYAPLFQVGLTMQTDQTAGLREWGEQVELLDARVPAAKYDLAFSLTEHPELIDIEISYATDLFDAATVQRFGRYFVTMLTNLVVAADDAAIGGLDILDVEELAGALAPVRTALGEASTPEILGDLLTGVEADPTRITLTAGESRISRGLFEARTNQLARELLARGIRVGDVVAIAIGRSAESVLTTVAVAKTGAAFVSVDPKLPRARQSAILADSGAVLGITTVGIIEAGIVEAGVGQAGTADAGPAERVGTVGPPPAAAAADEQSPIGWLVVDAPGTELEVAGRSSRPVGSAERSRPVRHDDLAYLIYTSGSTGTPKAAAVSHAGLATMARNQQRILGVHAESTVLHVAAPSFDASIFEQVMAINAGAELVVSPPEVYGGDELAELIATRRISHVVMTPAALATIDPDSVPDLHTVVSVGEACPPDLAHRWIASGRAFFNLYGPTETTIWATAAGPLRPHESVTIGPEVPGIGALVLDAGLRPLPPNVAGELYLTGIPLARGYHRRPDLTAARFVANPFGALGERMYRTGDRAARAADGSLIYLGRNDFQLKVRGIRLEPGEIDGVLGAHPAVESALTVGAAGPSGQTVLVSYVSPRTDEREPIPGELLDFAAERLPAHMVPHTVVVVDQFALTPSGKIDRRALPEVDFSLSREFVAPRTQLETVVAGVYAQVLGLDRVSVHDGFFELGGNSLSATKVTAQVGALLGRQIPVRDLFETSTVADFAASLNSTLTGQSVPPLTARRPRAEMVPVSGVQRSMWLLNRADPESAAYNVALALRLRGRLDRAALVAAVGDLVARHESLRTTYPMLNNIPAQVIVPIDGIDPATLVEYRAVDTASGESMREVIADVTGRGFDITSAIPLRAGLFRDGLPEGSNAEDETAAEEHVLVVVIHHISADGASMSPLARDLMLAYQARINGGVMRWPQGGVQYADYTLWTSERLEAVTDDGITEAQRQLNYWQERLSGAPEQLELPTDRPRPKTPSFAGGVVDFEVDRSIMWQLETLARTRNTTLFMVMHAAYAALLSRLSGREDIVIGTPYIGRDEPALQDVVGMFVNTLALRSQVSSDEPFAELLARVRTTDLEDMAHTDVAFDEIVGRVATSSQASHNPIFQVMFAFQNMEFPTLELAGLVISPESEELTAAKVDLQLSLFPNDPAGAEAGAPMRGQLIYARDLFDADTAARIADRYLRLLAAIAADPTAIVGDIALDEAEALTAVEDDNELELLPLSELVARAVAADATATAVTFDSVTVSFGDIDTMATALSAATPDPDSALTMALMTVVPGLVDAGPEGLDTVLADLRTNATALATATAQSEGKSAGTPH